MPTKNYQGNKEILGTEFISDPKKCPGMYSIPSDPLDFLTLLRIRFQRSDS